ncbi:MAG: hypothetical protein ACYTGQ_03390 [Planctomycetota bacterium]
MKRRDFITAAGLTTIASLTRFPEQQAAAAPAPVGASAVKTTEKRFLFFDLGKLDYWDNCELRQGEPEFVPEASYTDDSIPNKGAGKPNVWYDQQDGVWRMLYNIAWSPIRLMSAVSDDGVRWRRDPHPEVDVSPKLGGRLADHHVFTLPDAAAGGLYRDPIAADGYPFKMTVQLSGETAYQRALANPNHPWHAIARAEGPKRYFHDEAMLVSRDGLRWKLQDDYLWSRPDWKPEPPYFGFYNHALQRHAMVVRPGWGDRRVCLQTTEDFRTWSEPELLVQMFSNDTATAEIYTMPVFPCGQVYVGLLWVFNNSSSKPVGSFNQFYGTMDAQLCYSYDGVRFTRGPREPILPLNPYPQHGCSQLRPYSVVERDGALHIYSGGSRATHGRERKLQQTTPDVQAITLHRLRRDGWMYLRSRGDWARMQTKPMGVWSDDIHLNAAAPYGEIRYQLTDERSQPIEGFTFDDCEPFKADDQLDWPLRWKNAKTGDIAGKVIRLELQFENANIYSLTAAYHMLDAQDQWLLKEGKPIDTSRFDF